MAVLEFVKSAACRLLMLVILSCRFGIAATEMIAILFRCGKSTSRAVRIH